VRTRSAAALLTAYADRFDRALSDGTHSIASPLGAWLLVALVAPAASGAERDELEAALGTTAHHASRLAGELLATEHPAVTSALALWYRDGLLRPSFHEWARSLPSATDAGPIPSQAEADAWTARATKDLITRFPSDLDERVVLVLASALATRITWSAPFTLVPSVVLESPWAEEVRWALGADAGAHPMLIAHTDGAGDVAVVAATSDDELTVVSVIADPSVAAADVRAAALDVATLVVGGDSAVTKRSLFDLPLGNGPAWSIWEQPRRVDEDPETYAGHLPAWSTSRDHDLLALAGELGIGPACTCLSQFVEGGGGPFQAKQVATASFDRLGFEAAAITDMAARGMAPASRPEVQRRATLRFGHPYAVVVVATDDDGGPWHGVPVFSAWVAEPAESGPA
jgi:hypothetical protein